MDYAGGVKERERYSREGGQKVQEIGCPGGLPVLFLFYLVAENQEHGKFGPHGPCQSGYVISILALHPCIQHTARQFQF